MSGDSFKVDITGLPADKVYSGFDGDEWKVEVPHGKTSLNMYHDVRGTVTIPADCVHNAHMFYLKCRDLEERTALIRHLKANDILAVFHYIPLHSAPAGKKFGRFDGADVYTTAESERLVRLPMYYGLTEADRNKVIAKVLEFYAQ